MSRKSRIRSGEQPDLGPPAIPALLRAPTCTRLKPPVAVRFGCALAAALCLYTPSESVGQGLVVFRNFGEPPMGRIFDGRTGDPLQGTNWLAELYWAAGPDRPADSLAPVGAPLTFRTDGAAGFLDNGHDPDHGLRILPGTQEGDPITLQVRAWNAVAGASYEEALADPNGVVGESTAGNSEAGSMENPTILVGFFPFSVEPVPEPSAPAMLAIGLTLFAALRRRRKQISSGHGNDGHG
jgi:PEP-CTERM motif